MYYLPLFIQKRRIHYFRLEQGHSTKRKEKFSFVVEKRPGKEVELFRFLFGCKFISSERISSDEPLFQGIKLRRELYVEKGKIHFQFIESNDGSRFDKSELSVWDKKLRAGGFWMENRARDFVVGVRAEVEAGPINLDISYRTKEGITYRSGIIIQTGKAEDIVDAVFDFGSEASQMAYQFRSKRGQDDLRFNILESLYYDFYQDYLEENESNEDEVRNPFLSRKDLEKFIQFAGEDEKLFISKFFIKKGNTGIKPVPGEKLEETLNRISVRRPFQNGEEGVVQILGEGNFDSKYFTTKNKGLYQLIPNLKLMEMGVLKDFRVFLEGNRQSISFSEKKEFFFQRLINQFLHVLLRRIDSGEPRPNKLLRLTLLVPNIYSQKRVHDLLKNSTRFISRIMKEFNYGFSGFELQTLSESDASFLGLLGDPSVPQLQSNRMSPQSHFLILDAGKGTMDLSVITTGGRGNSFSSDFRSGFAGSGNAITYAFLETILAYLAGHQNSNYRKRLLKMIIEGDSYYALKLMAACEELKKGFRSGVGNHIVEYHRLERVLQEKLNSPNLRYKGNPDHKLDRLLEIIKDGLAENDLCIGDYYGLIESTVNEIVDRIFQLIRTSGKDSFPVVILSGRGFKFQPLREALEARMKEEFATKEFLFIEGKAKESCLYGPFNFPWGVNKNSDQVGIPVIVGEQGQFRQAILNIFSNKSGIKGEDRYLKGGVDLTGFDFYLNGRDIDYTKERIEISGVQMQLPSDFAEKGRINIVYVGEDFLIRVHSDSRVARPNISAVGKEPLTMKSVFPHIGPEDLNPSKILVVPKEREGLPSKRTAPKAPPSNPRSDSDKPDFGSLLEGRGSRSRSKGDKESNRNQDDWTDQIKDLI